MAYTVLNVPLCLTAIFGKIGRKSLNHVQALKSNPVECKVSNPLTEYDDVKIPGLTLTGYRKEWSSTTQLIPNIPISQCIPPTSNGFKKVLLFSGAKTKASQKGE